MTNPLVREILRRWEGAVWSFVSLGAGPAGGDEEGLCVASGESGSCHQRCLKLTQLPANNVQLSRVLQIKKEVNQTQDDCLCVSPRELERDHQRCFHSHPESRLPRIQPQRMLQLKWKMVNNVFHFVIAAAATPRNKSLSSTLTLLLKEHTLPNQSQT